MKALIRQESATDFMLRKAYDFREWLTIGDPRTIAANDAEFEKLMAESNRKLVSFNGISNSGVNNPLESLVRATFNGENNGTFR